MADSISAQQNPKKLKLYSHWISSCSWRVRTALNLKRLEYDCEPINLIHGASSEFMKLSPLGYVPVLVDGDIVIADSTAIILYLEDKYPQHSLLPNDLKNRALHYQVANIIASNIQPFQNHSVITIIEEKLGSDEKMSWIKHHITKGFVALENLLKDHAGKYAIGDEIGLADVYLEAQIHQAITRFNIDITEFPLLKRLHDAYSQIKAFQDAAPENQPDAPKSI